MEHIEAMEEVFKLPSVLDQALDFGEALNNFCRQLYRLISQLMTLQSEHSELYKQQKVMKYNLFKGQVFI